MGASKARINFWPATLTKRKCVRPSSKNISGVRGDVGGDEREDQVGAALKDEEEVGAEEADDPPIRIARSPNTPSPEDLEKHYATHTPHRSWCPECVKARGK